MGEVVRLSVVWEDGLVGVKDWIVDDDVVCSVFDMLDLLDLVLVCGCALV